MAGPWKERDREKNDLLRKRVQIVPRQQRQKNAFEESSLRADHISLTLGSRHPLKSRPSNFFIYFIIRKCRIYSVIREPSVKHVPPTIPDRFPQFIRFLRLLAIYLRMTSSPRPCRKIGYHTEMQQRFARIQKKKTKTTRDAVVFTSLRFEKLCTLFSVLVQSKLNSCSIRIFVGV